MENALAAYDIATFLQPDHVGAYNNRGIVRSMIGQHELAIADYSAAIRLKPDLVEAYSNRGGRKTYARSS